MGFFNVFFPFLLTSHLFASNFVSFKLIGLFLRTLKKEQPWVKTRRSKTPLLTFEILSVFCFGFFFYHIVVDSIVALSKNKAQGGKMFSTHPALFASIS